MELLDKIKELFGLSLIKTEDINFTLGALIALVLAFLVTSFLLRIIRQFLTRRLPIEDKNKFISLFQFIRYVVYIFVIMFTLKATGIDVTVLLTASAAIFIGLGFALQQLFQDLIAGILIILDQSLKVGDIIEIDDRICRVDRISLRSTRAYTRNERVVIIPNHIFMTDILINWTQNNNVIRESINIGVAYGSDTELVKNVLIACALKDDEVLSEPKPTVVFENFGDSSLDFILYFYIDNGFVVNRIKSDIRFEIDRKFREHQINIPFPQRDVHIFNPVKADGSGS